MNSVVYTIGETVLDILFSDGAPVQALPGGAMLNTSVSLARLGTEVHFVSEYGDDRVGQMVDAFLLENHVGTRHVYRYPGLNTSVALAFLDHQRNAGYEFYKVCPPRRLATALPEVRSGDIVAFGSFFGISDEVHPVIFPFMQQASRQGALIFYDPNFRKPHVDHLEELKPRLMQNFALADVVRASDEDLQLILGVDNPQDAWKLLQGHCKVLVYTTSNKAWWFSASQVVEGTPPVIEPVSTVGAGDTFNAGLIYGMVKRGVKPGDLESLSSRVITEIMDIALCCASEVCLSYDNYISESFAEALR